MPHARIHYVWMCVCVCVCACEVNGKREKYSSEVLKIRCYSCLHHGTMMSGRLLWGIMTKPAGFWEYWQYVNTIFKCLMSVCVCVHAQSKHWGVTHNVILTCLPKCLWGQHTRTEHVAHEVFWQLGSLHKHKPSVSPACVLNNSVCKLVNETNCIDSSYLISKCGLLSIHNDLLSGSFHSV